MRGIVFCIPAFTMLYCNRIDSSIKYYSVNGFVLAETCRDANMFKSYDRGYCEYPIYYIGPVRDTICTGRRYHTNWTPWSNANYFNYSRNYTSDNLKIRVDTAIDTNCRKEYLLTNNEAEEDSTLNLYAYMVTLENTADSILFMGRTFSVYLAWREAKDRNDNWVKIEIPVQEASICLTNEPEIFLYPHEMIISKIPRYTGNFITEFRFAFGYGDKIVYSNTFRDAIDEKILISPYVNY